MLTISIHKPVVFRFSNVRIRSNQKFIRIGSPWKMEAKSPHKKKMEELSIELPKPSVPQFESSEQPDDLQFDRLQTSDEDLVEEKKFEFGQFVAREATLDEEYWTAAWLRAESHWEDRANDRYADSHKRKFAEQVKKETKNVKRTVLKSVVGTLDLSIRHLLDGETFPGERVKARLFCSINRAAQNKYGYISNLCVAKAARRLGIASNMLHFAVKTAMLDAGVKQVYVHVHRKNKPAQDLYQKMGFEIVEKASCQLIEEQTYLLRFKA